MLKQGRLDLVSGLAQNIAPSPNRRAKIICTIGPSCDNEPVLRDLLLLGMDVARLNFSHGTHREHARNIARLRRIAKQENRTICILQDLQGPKIRTGPLKDHAPVTLKSGARVTISPRDLLGTSSLISTTFSTLAQEVRPDARILLSDGLIELRVRSSTAAFSASTRALTCPAPPSPFLRLPPKTARTLNLALNTALT